ncbi:unnamed protein product, partial [Prorocentrum cordatum]
GGLGAWTPPRPFIARGPVPPPRNVQVHSRGPIADLSATYRFFRVDVSLPAPGPPLSLPLRRRLYVVQFGNNSGLLRQLLRGRPCWGPAPGDPGSSHGAGSYQDRRVTLRATGGEPEVNFLWSQYRCSGFLNAMASGRVGLTVSLNEESTIKFRALPAQSGGGASASSAPPPVRAHNHFEGNGALCTKRGICECMSDFYRRLGRDPFSVLPLTFILRQGTADPRFAEFSEAFGALQAEAGQAVWLVKPGEWSNRGAGIRIYRTLGEIAARVDAKERVWAVQKYIERPLLIHKRKFDIRAYCLVTQEPGGGAWRAYCFRDAYLRLTSVKYTLKGQFNKLAHLNNDAIQKHGEDYGKSESANKMSLDEWQKYADEHMPKDNLDVRGKIWPQIQACMADAVRAAAPSLNPRGISNCFEVYGFDFMVDASHRAWIIECNANPCLELVCAYLSHLIPAMLDQALRLTVDRMFVAEGRAGQDSSPEESTKWDLVYDSSRESWPSDVVGCSWAETLPDGIETPAAMLGRAILCSKKKRKKEKDIRVDTGQDEAAKEFVSLPTDKLEEQEAADHEDEDEDATEYYETDLPPADRRQDDEDEETDEVPEADECEDEDAEEQVHLPAAGVAVPS